MSGSDPSNVSFRGMKKFNDIYTLYRTLRGAEYEE